MTCVKIIFHTPLHPNQDIGFDFDISRGGAVGSSLGS